MHRFYLPPEECQADELSLSGAEAHHARDVLRLGKGERVVVLDGVGHEYSAVVRAFAGDSIRLTVEEKRQHARFNGEITLLQAVPKGKIMDGIVQKATELGVFRIVPLITERVVAKFDGQDGAHKAAKWQSVAREAIKQCGSPWLPIVEPPTTPHEFLRRDERFELPLLASLQERSRSAREYFQAFETTHRRIPASLAICVGPEGDFTAAELESLQAHGFLPITLGPLVLRTETAAIYCLSIINHELHSAKQARSSRPQA
jgi:16S rRNA (uracil1498-N3)-methyltransferase